MKQDPLIGSAFVAIKIVPHVLRSSATSEKLDGSGYPDV